MIATLLIAWCLMALCVIIHSIGLMETFRWASRSPARVDPRFWPPTWLLIRMASRLIAIHLVEIAVWATFYWKESCLPDGESALYFAGVTYTTLGYGDLLLPKEWRLLAPIEGLTGILMCGLSTGFFFAVVRQMYEAQMKSGSK